MGLVIITTHFLENTLHVIVVTAMGQYLRFDAPVQYAMGVVTRENYLLVVGIPGSKDVDTVMVPELLLKRIKAIRPLAFRGLIIFI